MTLGPSLAKVNAEPGRLTHEGRSNDGLKATKKEACCSKSCEVGGCSGGKQYTAPGYDKATDDFAGWEVLCEVTCGPFSEEIGKIKYRCKPAVLVRCDTCACEQIEDCAVGECLLVDVL